MKQLIKYMYIDMYIYIYIYAHNYPICGGGGRLGDYG